MAEQSTSAGLPVLNAFTTIVTDSKVGYVLSFGHGIYVGEYNDGMAQNEWLRWRWCPVSFLVRRHTLHSMRRNGHDKEGSSPMRSGAGTFLL